MDIEVLEIRFTNRGDGHPLKAFADVRIGNWIIRDWRVEHHTGQRMVLSSPVSSWRNPQTRQVMYKGIISMPVEDKQVVEIAVLNAYQRALEANNEHTKTHQ